MAEALRKGDAVRQKVFVIEGTVIGVSVDQETFERQYLVTYTDELGNEQERFFAEGAIEKA